MQRDVTDEPVVPSFLQERVQNMALRWRAHRGRGQPTPSPTTTRPTERIKTARVVDTPFQVLCRSKMFDVFP